MFTITVYYFKKIKTVIPISLKQVDKDKSETFLPQLHLSPTWIYPWKLFESAAKTDRNDSYHSNMEL